MMSAVVAEARPIGQRQLHRRMGCDTVCEEGATPEGHGEDCSCVPTRATIVGQEGSGHG